VKRAKRARRSTGGIVLLPAVPILPEAVRAAAVPVAASAAQAPPVAAPALALEEVRRKRNQQSALLYLLRLVLRSRMTTVTLVPYQSNFSFLKVFLFWFLSVYCLEISVSVNVSLTHSLPSTFIQFNIVFNGTVFNGIYVLEHTLSLHYFDLYVECENGSYFGLFWALNLGVPETDFLLYESSRCLEFTSLTRKAKGKPKNLN
jgi:hypothetical protein